MALELKAKGNASYSSGDYDAAIRFYTQALQTPGCPSTHVIYANRSAAHLGKQDYEAAKADAESCLAIDPTFWKATLRLSSALKELGETKKALVVVQVGLKRIQPEKSDKGKKRKFAAGEKELRRMERDLKAEMQPVGGAKGAGGRQALSQAMMSGASSEELKELSQRQKELGRSRAQIQRMDNEIKREALCLKQLEELEGDVCAYKAVGRVFMKKDATAIKAEMEDATEKPVPPMVKDLTALKKKKEYFEKEHASVQKQIGEVVGRQRTA